MLVSSILYQPNRMINIQANIHSSEVYLWEVKNIMAELVWEEGMSVGIDSLDNDHKQLIDISAQLMSAKNSKLEQDSITDVFEQL